VRLSRLLLSLGWTPTSATAAYFGSLVATLYASLVMHSYLFSLIFCGAQVGGGCVRGVPQQSCMCSPYRRPHPPAPQLVTLVYYIASYFPGGAAGAQVRCGSLIRRTSSPRAEHS
jgi:hypothetical protein